MEAVLYAQERSKETRATLNSLRENGNIPAILYGKNVSNAPILMHRFQLRNWISKNNSMKLVKMVYLPLMLTEKDSRPL